MGKIAIVTDSTAYIPAELVRKHDIHVLPQVLIWGNDIYQDGVDISPTEFYTRLSSAKVMPTTSQVTPQTILNLFQRLQKEGVEEILCILISSRLSGTIGSFNQAKEMAPGLTLHLVDSFSTSMQMGFQVLMAARTIESGGTINEAIALAEKVRENSGLILTPNTLEFLHRGGRIGGASRFLGTALNIKPILEIRGGRVEPLERVRTRKKTFQRILEIVQERVGDRRPLRLAFLHANDLEDMHELASLFETALPADEVLLAEVSPVVGSHAGPGTVGVAFVAGI